MVLKAMGKYIDTAPIGNLLSQEEAEVDVIWIEVDRYYDNTDLSEFAFVMRGAAESGSTTQQSLTKITEETVIRLQWRINGLFTANSGKLRLDLFGHKGGQIIRYQLPPVEIRQVPPPGEEIRSSELTALLTEIQAAADDAKRVIEASGGITAAQIARIDALEAALSVVRSIKAMTASEYAALENPEADVLYLVTEDV